MSSTQYTYGDSDVAAERLGLLAQALGDTSRSFLREVAPERVQTAIDIGCGPGHTTRIVGEATGAQKLIGLDASPLHIERARENLARARFVLHDVTDEPLPGAPADLISGRFVLGHLAEPRDAFAVWAAALTPGGVLAAEEYERIDSDSDLIQRYLEVVESMVASEGAKLRLGPDLGEIPTPDGTEPVANRVGSSSPDPALAGRIFLMNMPAVRQNQAAVEAYGEEALAELEAKLTEFVTKPDPVVFHTRQVAFRRTGNADAPAPPQATG